MLFKRLPLLALLFLATACQVNTKTTQELNFPLGTHQWDNSQDYNYAYPSDACPGCPVIHLSQPSSYQLENDAWRVELNNSTTFNLQGTIQGYETQPVCGPYNDMYCSNEWRIWGPGSWDSGTYQNTPGGYFSYNGDFNIQPSFQCGINRLVLAAQNSYGVTRTIIEVNRKGGVCDVPTQGPTVAIRLNWDTYNTDLDLHLLREGAQFADPMGDCYYATCTASNSMGTSNLDWGQAGNQADNPLLDVDNDSGIGPENIFLESPSNGTYTVMVHYYQGMQTTLPDIELWVDNELRSWTTMDAWLPDFKQGDVWTPITFKVQDGRITSSEVQTVTSIP